MLELDGLQSMQDRPIGRGQTPDSESSPLTHKIEQQFPHEEQSRIFEALTILKYVSHDQKPRDNGTTAISHSLAVTEDVLDFLEKPDADAVIAALLHDAVEDHAEKILFLAGRIPFRDIQEEALDVLRIRFGRKVQTYVSLCTNPPFDGEITRAGINPVSSLYAERKNALYAKHVEACIQDPVAVLIKYCDFRKNAFSLDELSKEQKHDQRLQKYTPVIKLFLSRFETGNDIPVKQAARLDILGELHFQDMKMSAELHRLRMKAK